LALQEHYLKAHREVAGLLDRRINYLRGDF